MAKIKYYKVVARDSQGLKSAFVGNMPNKTVLSVYYKVGEWAYPNSNFIGSHLMAFDSLNEAKRFLLVFGWGEEIYECEVEDARKKGLFITEANPVTIKNVLSLKNKKKAYLPKCNLPSMPNTVFCDAIKLTKRVV